MLPRRVHAQIVSVVSGFIDSFEGMFTRVKETLDFLLNLFHWPDASSKIST